MKKKLNMENFHNFFFNFWLKYFLLIFLQIFLNNKKNIKFHKKYLELKKTLKILGKNIFADFFLQIYLIKTRSVA
jgi:uncharacterized membrane protein YbhN (UPF0104 family)